MSNAIPIRTGAPTQALANTTTIRNAYLLLTMILGVSALTAWYAIASNAQMINVWIFLAFMIGMPYLIHATRNSPAGLAISFAYAGLLGYFLGPIVGIYFRMDPNISQKVVERFNKVRETRDNAAVTRTLAKLREATVKDGENLMPYLVDCCHAYATVGEMVSTLKQEWGEFQEPVRL